MSELKNVWIVKGGWTSGSDNNNEHEYIEGVFGNMEYAINYILNRLAGMKDEEDLDFTMPDKEDLYMNWGFRWDNYLGGTSYFTIEVEQVDRLYHEEYKEDQHV